MRLANLAGRLVLLRADRAVDVVTGGRLPADPQSMFDAWDELARWAPTIDPWHGALYDPSDLGPPVPAPRQIFAVALNYRPHAAEAGLVIPEQPLIFTKFPACLTGPKAASSCLWATSIGSSSWSPWSAVAPTRSRRRMAGTWWLD